MSEFEKELDKNMQKRNIYYKDLINDKVISRLKVNQAKKKSFINFMKSIGKLGGQNKVPRISNDNSIIEKIKKNKLMRKIAVLGSTGSIGKQTLEVIEKNKDIFNLDLISANSNYKLLAEQAINFNQRLL